MSFSKESLTGMVRTVNKFQKDLLCETTKIDNQTNSGFPDMTIKMSSLFQNPPPKTKTGKFELASYLAKFWLTFRCMERKSRRLPRTLTSNLDSVSKIMSKIEEMAKTDVAEEKNQSHKIPELKSHQVTTAERQRKFLDGGGFKVPKGYENCVMCGHCYVDQLPGNSTNHDTNKEVLLLHEKICNEWKEFKDGKRENAPVNKDGKTLTKRPAAPKTLHDIFRCHCIEFSYSHYSNNSNCPIKCTDPLTKLMYDPNECPICNCSCMFACRMVDYNQLVSHKFLHESKDGIGEKTSIMKNKAAANHWFDCAAKAETLARDSTRGFLCEQRKKGMVNCTDDNEFESFIDESGAFAKAEFIVRNKPDFSGLKYIRDQIKLVQHHKGVTKIERDGKLIDLRNEDGRKSAASARISNNRLIGANEIILDDSSSDGVIECGGAASCNLGGAASSNLLIEIENEKDEDRTKMDAAMKVDRMKKGPVMN